MIVICSYDQSYYKYVEFDEQDVVKSCSFMY